MATKETALRPLMTPWGENLDREHPLPEYPRPQLRRAQWQCLNGIWSYAITDDGAMPSAWDGEIVVPFSPECVLSGVSRQLLPGQTLWYRRTVRFEGEGGRLLLHFGAVDQRCTVYVGGVEVGRHVGGYWPFTLDITDAAQTGNNTLLVTVQDDADGGREAWGKQRLRRGGIWYTAQSGIWQTVWCERVPETFIHDVQITPLWREATVSFVLTGPPVEATIEVFDGDTTVAQGLTTNGTLRLAMPADFRSWSPDDPFLYTVRITMKQDRVESYFGMRELGIIRDANGHSRLALNGEPIFHSGLLDQGYWSDGMYTPPSDEAMIWELTQVKRMGFNMLRKHIKIEPLRWYYHCDRLGLLVWQDFVSGGAPYNPVIIQALPFVGIRLRDNRYKTFGRQDAAGRDAFLRDMARTVSLLRNVVSLAVWVPFNEGWGQFDACKVSHALHALDDTRPIDHASGWHDQGGGDFASFHVYYKHFRPKRDRLGRVLALTEFGGYSLPSPGHMSSEKLFGYRVYKSREAFAEAFKRLYEEDVLRYVPEGLSAAIYTQVSDVEDEINGLFTYDRREIKIDMDTVQGVNKRLLDK